MTHTIRIKNNDEKGYPSLKASLPRKC